MSCLLILESKSKPLYFAAVFSFIIGTLLKFEIKDTKFKQKIKLPALRSFSSLTFSSNMQTTHVSLTSMQTTTHLPPCSWWKGAEIHWSSARGRGQRTRPIRTGRLPLLVVICILVIRYYCKTIKVCFIIFSHKYKRELVKCFHLWGDLFYFIFLVVKLVTPAMLRCCVTCGTISGVIFVYRRSDL